jgi:hypothetical protein
VAGVSADEYLLDTPVVRAFVADVLAVIVAADSPASACDAIRPIFAQLLTDPDRLPARYQEGDPESGVRAIRANVVGATTLRVHGDDVDRADRVLPSHLGFGTKAKPTVSADIRVCTDVLTAIRTWLAGGSVVKDKFNRCGTHSQDCEKIALQIVRKSFVEDEDLDQRETEQDDRISEPAPMVADNPPSPPCHRHQGQDYPPDCPDDVLADVRVEPPDAASNTRHNRGHGHQGCQQSRHDIPPESRKGRGLRLLTVRRAAPAA